MNQSQAISRESDLRVGHPVKVKLRLARLVKPPRLLGPDGKRRKATDEERREIFWTYVEKQSECWVWKGTKNQWGYGRFNWGGKLHQTHRLAYFFKTGNDPFPYLVCHNCDNPSCVNPDHLFLGFDLDNSKDKYQKGRGNNPVGERHWKSVITDEQAIKIKREVLELITKFEKETGASRECIKDIVEGRRWKHIK